MNIVESPVLPVPIKQKRFIFDKPLFLAKGIFFIVYGAAAMLTFLPLYFEQQGLSGQQIGLLAAIPPAIAVFGTSVWGAVADGTQRHKQLFMLAIVGAMGSIILMPVMSGIISLGLIVAVHAFCFISLAPLIDNSALEILADQPQKYGQIRLWGSIGWGIAGPLVGVLVGWFGLAWAVYGHALLLLGGLFIARPLPIVPMKSTVSLGRGLKRLLQDRRWYLFLLIVFVGGFGNAVLRFYMFLYLKELSAGSGLMGVMLTIGITAELTMLALSARLLNRFRRRHLLIWAVVMQAIQLLAWSVIANPYAALPLHLLNGLSFGMLWPAAVAYAKKIAPPGMGATAQGLLSGVYFGWAHAAGALVGGYWYEQLGPWSTYRWSALVMLVGVIIFSLASSDLFKRVAVRSA